MNPSNIIWENRDFTSLHKLIRITLFLGFILGFMYVSYFIIGTIKVAVFTAAYRYAF